MKPLLALMAASTLLSAGLWSAEDEVKLKKEEVPAAVLETMLKAADGAALDDFERETKKGVMVFTATFTNKDKKEMEVTVDDHGKLVGVEAEDDHEHGHHDDDHEGKGGKHDDKEHSAK